MAQFPIAPLGLIGTTPEVALFCAKNRRTLLRGAELKLVNRGEFLDSLAVLEEGMRHFYIRAMQLKAVGGKPDEVDANLLKAVGIAEKVAVPASQAGGD